MFPRTRRRVPTRAPTTSRLLTNRKPIANTTYERGQRHAVPSFFLGDAFLAKTVPHFSLYSGRFDSGAAALRPGGGDRRACAPGRRAARAKHFFGIAGQAYRR